MKSLFITLLLISAGISRAQNIGIGTTTPLNYGGTGKALEINSSGNGYDLASSLVLSFNTTGTNYGTVGNLNFVQSNTSATDKRVAVIQSSLEQYPYGSLANPKGRLSFFTNDGAGLLNAMCIKSNGFVGLGIVNPPNKLSVTGNANFTGNVGIGNSSPARPLSFPATLGEKILLYPGSGGEVGIGVYGNELRIHSDNPGAKVSFGTQTNAGVFTEAGKFEISNGYALSVFGNIWANGITYNSDARFKKNIHPLNNSLQKILQLKGVEYEMMTDKFPGKNFTEGVQVGLLAQEVETVVPQVVNTNPDGYKSVDYAKLVPLLIEGIKEQQEQINKLKKEISSLKRAVRNK